MKNRWTLAFMLAVPCLALLLLPNAFGYESYHDPTMNDAGYCATCHPGFGGGRNDTLHVLHTGGSDPVTQNCNLCHTGSGRDNPLTLWSTGDNGDGRGCAGCHARDYGETIGADYGGFPITGLPKSSGYGLQKNHISRGITVCLDCHTEQAQGDILTEDVQPVFYARGDVSLNSMSVHSCTNEDTGNDADNLGLDNDGDLLTDSADPDCAICPDGDSDGYGDPGDPICPNGSQFDCDDSRDDIFPGATELFDGADNNCDGAIDEIEGVNFPDSILTPDRVAWTDQLPAGQLYDIIRSDDPTFPAVSPNSTCLAVGTSMTFIDDAVDPPLGVFFYYLVRNTLVTDYGNQSNLTPRLYTLCP